MKSRTALLSLAIFIAFAAVLATASTPAPTLPGMKTSEAALCTQSLKFAPGAASANPRCLFTVNDEKGLVLTCIAPELDTNPDTDMFKICTLAPVRTLAAISHRG